MIFQRYSQKGFGAVVIFLIKSFCPCKIEPFFGFIGIKNIHCFASESHIGGNIAVVWFAIGKIKLYRIVGYLNSGGAAHFLIHGIVTQDFKTQIAILIHCIECSAVSFGDSCGFIQDHFKQPVGIFLG